MRLPSAFAIAASTLIALASATDLQAEYRQRALSEEIAFARNICINVLRIKPGFVPFDACVESLAQIQRDGIAGNRSELFDKPAGTNQLFAEQSHGTAPERGICLRAVGYCPGNGGIWSLRCTAR